MNYDWQTDLYDYENNHMNIYFENYFKLINVSNELECRCPLSMQIFVDPVIASDGYTYERVFLQNWLKSNQPSPIDNQQNELSKIFYPNLFVKKYIMNNQIKNPSIKLTENFVFKFSTNHFNSAVKSSNIDKLIWLKNSGSPIKISPHTLTLISKSSDSTVLDWLNLNIRDFCQIIIELNCMKKALNIAYRSKNHDVIKWYEIYIPNTIVIMENILETYDLKMMSDQDLDVGKLYVDMNNLHENYELILMSEQDVNVNKSKKIKKLKTTNWLDQILDGRIAKWSTKFAD